MSMTSRVPSRRWDTASERIMSSVITPPAVRSTCASPCSRPSAANTSRRESMQVTMASRRLGRTSMCRAGSDSANARLLATRASMTSTRGTLVRDTGVMSDPGLLLVAELRGLVGRQSELHELLDALAEGARQEPGCSSFRVLAGDEPGEWVLLAAWRDEAALRAHYGTP